MRALIVDDSVTARVSLTASLCKRFPGAVVEEACDGVQAWQRLEQGGIDLLITDLDMYPVDGVALVQNLRRDPKHDNVRVLVHSACIDLMVRAVLGRVPLVELLPKPATDLGLAAVVQSLWQESGLVAA